MKDPGEFKMRFGKFKGKTLNEIPSSYLRWGSENMKDDEIATLMDNEWNIRERQGAHWEK